MPKDRELWSAGGFSGSSTVLPDPWPLLHGWEEPSLLPEEQISQVAISRIPSMSPSLLPSDGF